MAFLKDTKKVNESVDISCAMMKFPRDGSTKCRWYKILRGIESKMARFNWSLNKVKRVGEPIKANQTSLHLEYKLPWNNGKCLDSN